MQFVLENHNISQAARRVCVCMSALVDLLDFIFIIARIVFQMLAI